MAKHYLNVLVFLVLAVILLSPGYTLEDATACMDENCECSVGHLQCSHGHDGFPPVPDRPDITNFQFSDCLLDETLTSVPYPQALSLIIHNCALVSIAANAFQLIPGLEALAVTGNRRMNRIDRLAFNGLPNLTNLDLSANAIRFLPDGVFDNLPSLLELELNANPIQIGDSLFGPANPLMDLSCNNCGLTTLPELKLSKLISLELSHNINLKSVPANRFRSLPELESLALDNCRLTAIQVGAFNGLGKLETLRLGHNKLMSVSSSLFAGLDRLVHLELHNNLLTSLPESLLPWKSLNQVDLGFNAWQCDCQAAWMLTLDYVHDWSNVICSQPASLHGRLLYNLTTSDMCSTPYTLFKPLTAVVIMSALLLCLVVITVGCRIHKRRSLHQSASQQMKYNVLNEEQGFAGTV